MTKKSYESTYSKLLDNFELLLIFLKELGSLYNPSKELLQYVYLLKIYNIARTSMDNYASKQNLYTVAVDNRQKAFSPVGKLATRIINIVASSDIEKERIKDVNSINRKLQGIKAITPAAIALETKSTDANTALDKTNTISSIQKSYNMQLENIKLMYDFINNEPGYNPKEADITKPAIKKTIESLIKTNTQLKEAETALDFARIDRNKKLFDENGICLLAAEVKKYVKGALGASSPEFKKINAIPFRHNK